MPQTLSQRLSDILDSLPLTNGIRILEIGCGPGAMARAMAERVGEGFVLGIDRSARAIQQATSGSQLLMETGKLAFRESAIENFELAPAEKKFDLAVAIRVGALDGRHPEIERQALIQIAQSAANRRETVY